MGRRIIVYGVTGSGKTTLAAEISRRTGIPWHSVDDLTWLPGWVEVPHDVQRDRIRAICERDSWILDTVYWKWHEIPLGSADCIVALDYPRWVSLGRLFIRCIKRIADRKLICNGNRETFANTFLSRKSILCWHFRSFAKKRRRIEAFVRSENGPEVIRLRSAKATRRWLAALE